MQMWTPPIGIPAPDFGMVEVAPALPNPWTAEVPGFYFIEKSATNGSDSRTYGRPGAPRYTIPKTLPAGSVVVVHGNYNYSHASPNQIKCNGTKEQPVFILGDDAELSVPMRGWQLWGSYYIVEKLNWKLAASSESKPPCVKFLSPSDRGVVRYSKLGGNLTGGGVQVVSTSAFVSGSVNTRTLVWQNEIHDSGDINSTEDQDIHSVSIGGAVSQTWLLENEIHHSSGSGCQVNAGSAASQPNLHHIYLGRNHVHHTRQAGLAIKQANDVIRSENLIHDVINTSWSPAKGLGFQYAPNNVWDLFNEIYNCFFGIYSGSDSGMGTGKSTYHIGNVIHSIHKQGGTWNANSAWSEAGIMMAGGLDTHIIGNTLYDVDAGIHVPRTAGAVVIQNNIISKVTQPEGTHVFVEMGAVANASKLDHCLFDPTAKIKWGNNTVKTLAQIQSAGQGAGCVEGDPKFTGTVDDYFSLQAGSPAIDKGALADAYALFLSTYGIDISVDKVGNVRPQGAGWDMGAYEQTTAGPGPDPGDPCAECEAALKEAQDALVLAQQENAVLQAENTRLVDANAELTARINDAINALQGEPTK